ncbi:hypothetical protein ColKHC_05543 [Colletotrichum higginsianum]|nr:hypothetical protein ColKHC_05543 [Colletotrichum higginsianum]
MPGPKKSTPRLDDPLLVTLCFDVDCLEMEKESSLIAVFLPSAVAGLTGVRSPLLCEARASAARDRAGGCDDCLDDVLGVTGRSRVYR